MAAAAKRLRRIQRFNAIANMLQGPHLLLASKQEGGTSLGVGRRPCNRCKGSIHTTCLLGGCIVCCSSMRICHCNCVFAAARMKRLLLLINSCMIAEFTAFLQENDMSGRNKTRFLKRAGPRSEVKTTHQMADGGSHSKPSACRSSCLQSRKPWHACNLYGHLLYTFVLLLVS